MNTEQIVIDLIALNGGTLVGRTRLQKQAYLLDRGGANFGLKFTYHHYGPYSFELVEGVTDARANGLIRIDEKPGRYGVPYATFKSENRAELPNRFGKISINDAQTMLSKMNSVSDFVLELAATIVFLRDEWDYYGKGTIGPVEETRIRKPLKATDDRIERACTLLNSLGLMKKEGPR